MICIDHIISRLCGVGLFRVDSTNILKTILFGFTC